jgi:GGDEF domain-containing protein
MTTAPLDPTTLPDYKEPSMPRKSYKQIQREMLELQQENAVLRTYPPFNVTTRPGLEFELRRHEAEARYVVYMDVDNMHGANEKYGKSAVNGKLKRALHVRHADVLIRALYFSGDEFVIVLRGDPEGFMERLSTSLKNEGMSATMAYKEYSGDIDRDTLYLEEIVTASKKTVQRK